MESEVDDDKSVRQVIRSLEMQHQQRYKGDSANVEASMAQRPGGKRITPVPLTGWSMFSGSGGGCNPSCNLVLSKLKPLKNHDLFSS